MQKTYFNYISNIVALLWILAIWFASSDNSLHLKWTPLSIVTNVASLWSSGHCVKNPKLLHINLLLFNEIYIYANMSLHISNKRLFFQVYTSITCKIFVTKDKFLIYVNNLNYSGRCGSFYVCILHALKWLHNSFMLIIFLETPPSPF